MPNSKDLKGLMEPTSTTPGIEDDNDGQIFAKVRLGNAYKRKLGAADGGPVKFNER